MSLTSKNQLLIAFKKLVGKAHTNSQFGSANESVGSSIQLDYSTIFGQAIPSSPSSSLYSITNNIVEKVQFDLVSIDASQYTGIGAAGGGITADGDGAPTQGTFSNGIHAYALKLPSNYQTLSSNPKKATGVFINGQSLTASNGGLQIVPEKYGSQYPAVISSSSGIIATLDEEDYLLDPYSGILFLQDINRVPTSVTAYIYIGDYLTERVSSSLGQFTTVSASVISASSYIGLSNVGGSDQTVQFNSGSVFSGSTNLVYNYTTNILSGTTAQFTNITGSFSGSGAGLYGIPTTGLTANTITVGSTSITLGGTQTIIQGITELTASTVTGSIARFTTISGSTVTGSIALFTTVSASNLSISGGNVLIEQTDINLGDNAYIDYNSSIDKLAVFPGLYITGALTASTSISASNIGATSAQITTISGSTVTGSTALFTSGQFTILTGSSISGSNIKGTTAEFATITGSTITGSVGLFTSITASHSGSGAGLFNIPITGLTANTITVGSTSIILGGTATTIQGITELTASTVTGSTAKFTTISASIVSASTYVGIPPTNPGDSDKSVQFNSGSTFSGSTNLIYDYTTNTLSGTTAQFTTITGSIVTGSTATFTTISASVVSASSFVGPINGNLTGTASYASNADLLDNLDSTAFAQLSQNNTFTGINIFNNKITGTYATFTNDIFVLGTASIAQLNTLNQTSLNIGDKYITILTGSSDHLTLDGSGLLWGSSSVSGVTHDELGADAHVRFDAGRDKLRIFPGLFVSGGNGAEIADNLIVTGSTTLTTISGTNARFTIVTASFTGSGAGLYNIPTTGLTANTITVGSTSISLGATQTIIQGITELTASTVTGSTARFTTISASIVSASSFVGVPLTNPGDSDKSVQFNSGSTFSGSTNLTWDYSTNNLFVTGNVNVSGTLTAIAKSFDIQHPTKLGMRLRYGSLEGPENGVYVRGITTGNVVELPEHWIGLVYEDTITVNLTPIGGAQNLWVDKIENNKVYIGGDLIKCYFAIFAERKDIDKLIVEY